jgi:hypothetical protein
MRIKLICHTPTACLLVLVSLGAGRAGAAVITFGAAQQITGDSDILTNGTTDRAYLFAANSGPPDTINGVTFTEFDSNGGNPNGDTSTFTNGLTGVFGSGNPPYSNLSQAYQILLSSAHYNGSTGTPASITLNNLTVGDDYEIQVFVNDSRDIGGIRSESISGSPYLEFNTTGSDGGLGEYVTGTFTADSTSQTLTFTPASDNFSVAQVNGLQLRNLSAVPEPSSLVLLGVGAITGLGYARARRRVKAVA